MCDRTGDNNSFRSFSGGSGWKWLAVDSFADQVLKRLAGGVGSLEQRAHLMKKSTSRAVFRMDPENSTESTLIVKRHVVRSFGETLKFTFSKSRAKEEWNILHALKSCGIPCPEPIAIGEKHKGGLFFGACLVIGFVDVKELLPGALKLSKPQEGRQDLLDKLGALVRTIHDNGFDHHDLHSGNFLIVKDEKGSSSPFPIDFHDVSLKENLSLSNRVAGVAKLCFSMESYTNEDDRVRLIKAYLCAGQSISAFEPFLEKITAMAARLKRRRILSRSRRCMLNSSVFIKEKADGRLFFRQRVFDRSIARKAIDLHKTALKEKSSYVFKNHPKTAVTRVDLPGIDLKVCVKEFKGRGILISIYRRFFGSKARRAWRNANGLRVRGIDTPDPMACVEQRRFGLLLVNSYLICEYYENSCPLDHYLRDDEKRAFILNNHEARGDLIDRSAALLKALHEMGAKHRDLSLKNWLVRINEGRWRITLVDVDDVDFCGGPTRDQELACFVQMYDQPEVLSNEDRLRFLKKYSWKGALVGQNDCPLIKKGAEERWRRHCNVLGIPPDKVEPVRK